MESGAKGCEVVVSGKLRGQRAKSMKFVDGLMIHSGDPVNYYVDTAVRHVLLRQGEYSSTKDTAAALKINKCGFAARCHWESFDTCATITGLLVLKPNDMLQPTSIWRIHFFILALNFLAFCW